MKELTLLFSTATLALFYSTAEAAVITVNTTNNVNPLPLIETSLQQALTNLHDGDTIQFNIPGNGPFHLQTPTNGYPIVTNNSITIDGYSQPGSSPNTNEILAPNNAKIQIVLDSQGLGATSTVLAGLDWVMQNRNNPVYNIKVVNMSLGTPSVDSYLYDPLCQAVRRLVDAGVVVVAAAGNQGKDAQGTKLYGLIHSPGNDPSVITVGATNTFGTDARNDDATTSRACGSLSL